MSDWKKVKLSECCLSIADGDHQPPPKAEQGIPFVTISNITSSNQFDFSNTLYVPQDYYDRLDEKRKAREGDVLYSVVGSFGIPVFMKENKEFVFQRHIAILRPDSDAIIPQFLFYIMLTRDFYAKADAAALGAAQRTISLTSLRNIEISIPEKKAQLKIVEILSAFDNLIENNQKQIKLLEEAAQRLYKEWFVDLRFPGHEDMQIVDGVPEGWKIVSLDDVISKITTGLNPRKNFVLGKGNNFYVTIKNMGDNNRKHQMDVFMKGYKQACDSINHYGVKHYREILKKYYGLNAQAIDALPDSLLYMVLLSDDMKSYCDQNAHGVAQRGIRMADLRAYKLLLPDDNILKKYTYISKPLIQKVQALQKQCKELTEARDRLLPKLMSGEIEL